MTKNTAKTTEPVWDSRNSEEPQGQRERFEAWVSAPPYEWDVSRFPDDESIHAWPGNYVEIEVQLAWEAWCEALTGKGEAVRREG